jgi:uracil-DNA glycosylase
MIHPRALIRQTAEKKQAWQDLLKLKSWLSSRRTEES